MSFYLILPKTLGINDIFQNNFYSNFTITRLTFMPITNLCQILMLNLYGFL